MYKGVQKITLFDLYRLSRKRYMSWP